MHGSYRTVEPFDLNLTSDITDIVMFTRMSLSCPVVYSDTYMSRDLGYLLVALVVKHK